MSWLNYISEDSWTAKRQLWDRLPGIHECSRSRHHDIFIRGDEVLEPRSCTSADLGFAFGESHIIRRRPTDPNYESELLLKSILLLNIKNTHHRAVQTQHHVLRLQTGEWSYWLADADGIVIRKIRDLEYNDPSPKFTGRNQPWNETYGSNRYLSLEFSFSSGQLSLTITHRIKWENGRETVEVTSYDKVGEVEQEGWSKWLKDEMKAGYQRRQAYGSEAEV